jgi:hypothetical protein
VLARLEASAILLALAAPLSAQMSPPVPPAELPAHCTAPEYRQFDFWLGEWRVFQTAKPTESVGSSLIDSVYNGCGIRENWRPFSMLTGGSLNNFDRRDGRWHQTWIDSSGARVEFVGGVTDGKMMLTGVWRDYGGPGKDALVRMTYSRLSSGDVRQLGEASSDGGKSWRSSFDFTYQQEFTYRAHAKGEQ